jgi:hypothetical protein
MEKTKANIATKIKLSMQAAVLQISTVIFRTSCAA